MGIDMFATRVKTASLEVDLVVWDTAGQERHFSLTKGRPNSSGYFRKASVALVVFDISDSKSFERRPALRRGPRYLVKERGGALSAEHPGLLSGQQSRLA
jgi:hypothetical protein